MVASDELVVGEKTIVKRLNYLKHINHLRVHLVLYPLGME